MFKPNYMKYLITLSILCGFLNLHAQDSSKVRTVQSIVTLKGNMIPKTDTTLVFYDEKGKALHYYQYDKLFRSGLYSLKYSTEKATYGKQIVTRLSDEEVSKFSSIIREHTELKNPFIYKGKKLDIAPLTAFYEPEQLANKIIIQVYWYASCGTCTEHFTALSAFIKELGDPKDVIILAITTDNNDVAVKKLKELPLRNAQLISSGKALSDAYQITAFPAYIVTDRNHVITHAAVGSSRLTLPDLKEAIKAVVAK